MAFDKRKALQNALAYTQQGKWDRAIAEYQAILRSDPRDVTVCNNLGDLYARAGKTAEAIDQYMKLGELYRADGLSVKAIAVYKKIAKLDPARTEAYLACADLYWEQGLVGEAKIQMATVVEHYSRGGDTQKLIDAYRRLTQFDPGNSAVIVRLADAMLRDGKREAAAAEYERAAQAAQAAGQPAEAKRLLQKAREFMPSAPKVDVAQAERLIGEGKTSDALEMLKTITEAEPGNAQAWRLLGEMHAAAGQAGPAVAALQRAVGAGMAEAEIARPLGMALLHADQTDDAVALCRRVTETGLAAGQPDAAIACCRELLAAAPQVIDLHAYLAATLLGLGRTEEAQGALRTLAAAQEAAGTADAAIETYRKLLELNASDAEARARLEALQPPAPPAESPSVPPPSAPDLTAPQEPTVELGAEAPEPPVEDLSLSLGADDAALLLEEPDAAAPADVAGRPLEAEATDIGAQPAAQEDMSQAGDWLTEELQTIDLDEAAPAAPSAPAEFAWAPDGHTLELEAVAPGGGSADLSGLAGESELDVAPTLARPDEPSPAIELPMEALSDDVSDATASGADRPSGGLDATAVDAGEDLPSAHVAEQLAEADVYQKYGLEEKARERLLEVVRLAPENVTAHRRLKALYIERRQSEEACGEVLALARILRSRGQDAAAAAEAREGLALIPDHPELPQFLIAARPADSAPPRDSAQRVDRVFVPPVPPPPAPPSRTVGGARMDGPPPDVPILLELEEEEAGEAAKAEAATEEVGSLSDEALPTELQALLDETEAEPILAETPVEAADDQAMADDLAEAEFYLSQGMTDEARAVLQRMQARDSGHSAVAALADQIDRATSEPPPSAPDVSAFPEVPAIEDLPSFEVPLPMEDDAVSEVVPQFTVADERAQEEQAEFVDLGAELAQELDPGAERAAAPSSGPLVESLLKELQKGVREHLDEKDYETHYNLGIAYKEMELYDEAIQEFRLTAREPKRALECADLVGLCYLAKGQPAQAIQDLEAGLAIQGHPADAYHTLRYDLGTAYEANGDVARAVGQFEILQSEGARFLDVQTRLEALHARLRSAPSPPAKDATPRRKKKISFI